MNLKMVTGIIALFMCAGALGLATAQDTTKNTHQKTRTLTGCLQKGDDANEYNLTAKDGGTWEIESDSVKLGEHVGSVLPPDYRSGFQLEGGRLGQAINAVTGTRRL